MKPSAKPLVVLATLLLTLAPLGGSIAHAATSDGTVAIDQAFPWSVGDRTCVDPPADSVICVVSSAPMPGLGVLEYARYAQNAPGLTKDGCARLSTHGTIWVPGGTAEFDGPPAATCGKGLSAARPDAHYLYTIMKGTGVLEGATGSGDIVADHGADIWKGTLLAPLLKGRTVPLASAAPSPSTVTASTGPGASPSAATSSGATSPGTVTSGAATSPSASIAPAVVATTSSSGSSNALWLVAGIVALVAIGVAAAVVRRRGATGRHS